MESPGLFLSLHLLALLAAVTSIEDRVCLGGLKRTAGVSKIQSSLQQLMPKEKTAAQTQILQMTLALFGLCVCLLINHSFQRDGVSYRTACHMATPVTRKVGCI